MARGKMMLSSAESCEAAREYAVRHFPSICGGKELQSSFGMDQDMVITWAEEDRGDILVCTCCGREVPLAVGHVSAERVEPADEEDADYTILTDRHGIKWRLKVN